MPLHLPIELEFALQVDKVLSENTLYVPTVGKRGSGRAQKSFAYLRLSKEGREFKKDLESRLDALITHEEKAILKALDKQKIRVSTHYTMYLAKTTLITKDGRFKQRNDITNMIKGTEDSIFKVLGFDDCNVRVSIAEKVSVDLGDDQPTFRPLIHVKMTIAELDAETETQRALPCGEKFQMKFAP